MHNQTHPTGTRTDPTGARKLLTLGHSVGITLPAKWFKANITARAQYLTYSIYPNGDLVLHAQRAGRPEHGEPTRTARHDPHPG